MMNISKVLIVAKKSAYQAYFHEYRQRPLRRLARKGDRSLLRIRGAHRSHYRTLSGIKAALKKRNIPAHVCFRGEIFNPANYDLVISVGGDGTFLEASHSLGKQVLLGVNSDRSHSIGKFCSAHAGNFEKRLDAILRRDFHVKQLTRLKINLNGKFLPIFALNDILVSHASPAAMSHYVLKVGRRAERQRSSGVWVSTAAGSSAAMGSAGGRLMSEKSKCLQYIVREPFEGHGRRYRLKGGILTERRGLSIVSQMQEGMLYVDGAHHSIPFEYGDEVRVIAGNSLQAVEFTER